MFLAFDLPLPPLFHNLQNEIWLEVVLVVHTIFCRAASFLALISIHILVNKVNRSNLIGIANGLGITLSSIGRLRKIFLYRRSPTYISDPRPELPILDLH